MSTEEKTEVSGVDELEDSVKDSADEEVASEVDAGYVKPADENDMTEVIHRQKKQTKNARYMTIGGKRKSDDAMAKIGAIAFFVVYLLIQLILVIPWIINGCPMDVVCLIFLPTLLVIGLFVVTWCIDLVTERKNKNREYKSKQRGKKGRKGV